MKPRNFTLLLESLEQHLSPGDILLGSMLSSFGEATPAAQPVAVLQQRQAPTVSGPSPAPLEGSATTVSPVARPTPAPRPASRSDSVETLADATFTLLPDPLQEAGFAVDTPSTQYSVLRTQYSADMAGFQASSSETAARPMTAEAPGNSSAIWTGVTTDERDALAAAVGTSSVLGPLSGQLNQRAPCTGVSCRPDLGEYLPANIWRWSFNWGDWTGRSTDPRIHAAVNQIVADVQWAGYNSTDAYIFADGIPSYNIGPFPGNPNVPRAQGFTLRFPHRPQEAVTHRPTNLGPIGVFVNGVALYNALDARSYQNQNVWHQDANRWERQSFDAALGHPQMQGMYHHHADPAALRQQLGDDGTRHSPLLGFAYDGFPIYGPTGYANPDGSGGLARMESSYRPRAITQRTTLPDGTPLPTNLWGPPVNAQYPIGSYAEDYEYVPGLGRLGEFNGRYTVTPEYPRGTFAYFVTIDAVGTPAYPYLVGPNYFGEVLWDDVQRSVVIPGDVVTYWP